MLGRSTGVGVDYAFIVSVALSEPLAYVPLQLPCLIVTDTVAETGAAGVTDFTALCEYE